MRQTIKHFCLLGILILIFTLSGHSWRVQLAEARVNTLSTINNWPSDCVDCPPSFATMSSRSLDTDASGNFHIAYGQDHLYHAWQDGVGWHVEVVDAAENVGQYASLALDATGHAHISYYDLANGDLKYAYQDTAGWHLQTLDSDGDVGLYTSIALDIQGYAHIVYRDSTHQDLKYAYQNSTGWHLEVADSAADPGVGTALALDENGYPHVAYNDAGPGNLEYAYQDESGWHYETLADNGNSTHLSMALDSNGYPHIAYFDANYTLENLNYMYWDGSSWHNELRQSIGYVGTENSIALDSNGYPHIVYYDYYTTNLRYDYRDADGWHSEVVDASGDVHRHASLALDSLGYAHLSYLDQTRRELRYAYRDPDGWQIEMIDQGGQVGDYSSIAIDAAGYAHISYYDATNSDLKYAYQDANGWHLQTVDANGLVGWFTSLALDADGFPHIFYSEIDCDIYCGPINVKYARQDINGWHIEQVDTATLSGPNALALDENGYPHVIYGKGTDDYYYAYADSNEWHSEVLPIPPTSSEYHALALDAQGYPHLGSLYNYLNSGVYLVHFYRTSTGWNTEYVFHETKTGNSVDITLDSAGYPRIALSLGDAGDILYARQYSGGWYTGTVTSGTFQEVSLALDQHGGVHLSFQADTPQRTDGDLRYASYTPDHVMYIPAILKR